MNITQSELNQIKKAVLIFSQQPERLADLFFSGKLRLCSEATQVLYYHYIGKHEFFVLADSSMFSTCEITLNETQKYIAKLFNDSKKRPLQSSLR